VMKAPLRKVRFITCGRTKNGTKITEIELRLQTEIKFDNAASTEKTTGRN